MQAITPSWTITKAGSGKVSTVAPLLMSLDITIPRYTSGKYALEVLAPFNDSAAVFQVRVHHQLWVCLGLFPVVRVSNGHIGKNEVGGRGRRRAPHDRIEHLQMWINSTQRYSLGTQKKNKKSLKLPFNLLLEVSSNQKAFLHSDLVSLSCLCLSFVTASLA